MSDQADRRPFIRGRMQQLAKNFLQRCVVDIATARDLLGRLYAGEAAAINDLARLAHRVAGTGGSLGFDEISRSAAAIERFAEMQIAGGRVDANSPQSLAELTVRLERDIHAAQQARDNMPTA